MSSSAQEEICDDQWPTVCEGNLQCHHMRGFCLSDSDPAASVCQGSCTDGKMGICTGKSEIQAGPWEHGLCYWPEPYFKDEWNFWWGELMQRRGWAVSGPSCCGNAESVASVWERSGIGSINRWVSVYQSRSTNTASTNCPEPGEREELIGENWAV